MPYVSVKCPNCKGKLSLDSNMEKGYCIHCGSLINFSDTIKDSKTDSLIESAVDDTHTFKYTSAIDRTLKEISLYQRMVKYDIEMHLAKAYLTSRGLALFSLLPVILFTIGFNLLLIDLDAHLILFTIPIIIDVIYFIFIIFIFVTKTGYDDIKRKISIKLQTNSFMKRCNNILKPLGIVDLAYTKDIFAKPNIDLEFESNKLQKAQDYILNIDKRIYYKKPHISYSVIDFLKGIRPEEYYDKGLL